MNRPVAGLPVTGRSTGPDRSNGRPAGLKCGPGPDRTGPERPVAGTGSIYGYMISYTLRKAARLLRTHPELWQRASGIRTRIIRCKFRMKVWVQCMPMYSGLTRSFWVLGNSPTKLFWRLSSHGQLKSQVGYSFSKVFSFFKANVYWTEKSTTRNQQTGISDVFVLLYKIIFQL
jgi:hypothetical protein